MFSRAMQALAGYFEPVSRLGVEAFDRALSGRDAATGEAVPNWGRLLTLSGGAQPAGFGLAARGASGARVGAKAAEAAAPQAQSMASKVFSLYNPRSKPSRPFAADYPAGGATDAAGRLLEDIEGRPLVARTVVGRRMVGAPDEALPPERAFSLGESITGRQPATVAGQEIGGDARRLEVTRNPRSDAITDLQIYLNRSLGEALRTKVMGHEVSHAIMKLPGTSRRTACSDGWRASIARYTAGASVPGISRGHRILATRRPMLHAS